MNSPLNLTIAVLSWRQPKTLKNTFESYQRNGLLDLAKQKLVFFNEVSTEDRKIAKEYGFEVLSSPQNIGIGLPMQELLKHTTSKYFLFLENDFMLIENPETTKIRLQNAIELLESGISAVKLRHRFHYGDPNYYLKYLWSGKLDLSEPSLNGVYYFDDLSKVYPQQCSKISKPTEELFIMDSQYIGYSNNPCIYKTEFFRPQLLSYKFTTKDVVENNIDSWWRRAGIQVAMGTGLFKHNPLEFSGSGFAEAKRIKQPIRNWTHYIIRIGIRHNVMNLFLLQFLPMIFKVNINIYNKFMINLSLGRYESV